MTHINYGVFNLIGFKVNLEWPVTQKRLLVGAKQMEVIGLRNTYNIYKRGYFYLVMFRVLLRLLYSVICLQMPCNKGTLALVTRGVKFEVMALVHVSSTFHF